MESTNSEYQFNNTLVLPDIAELRRRLKEKLEEYNSRIENYKKKYQVKKLGIVIDRESNMLDAIYKREILDRLLQDGKADLKTIHDSLYDEFKGYISEDNFLNAVSVITDYIKTGGRHTHGGTGFFTDMMFNKLLKESAALELPTSADQSAAVHARYYEYVGRNLEYEQKADSTVDQVAMKRNSYKMKILGRLLEKRRLFVQEFANELLADERTLFDKIEFYNALSQIQQLLNNPLCSQR